MSQNPRATHPLFVSLPIFWQVLGLSLSVLVLALGINTLVVLKAPAPQPSGYTIGEAVTALKGGEVRLQNGHRLRGATRDSAPDFVLHPQPMGGLFRDLQSVIRDRLARQLGVSEDRIFVSFRPRHDYLRPQDRPHGFFDDRHYGQADVPPSDGPGGSGFAGAAAQASSASSTSEQGAPATAPEAANADMGRNPTHPGPVGAWPGQHEMGQHEMGPHEIGRRDPGEFGLMSNNARASLIYPAFDAAWKLPDGSYRVIQAPRSPIEPWQARLLIGFGLTTLLIIPLAYLLSQRLARPIAAFSEAAAKLSVEDNAPPILAAGPREVRQAADVVNAMQARIRKQIESRTMLMGAIAHDLKTPLARMRLRIEDLPANLRDKLSQDIAHMDALIRSAMSFTSAHKLADQVRPLDLSALTESLIDDMGPVCEIEAAQIAPNIRVLGDQVALTRIVTNLIENAGRYASACRVELRREGESAVLSLLDNGPGLPEEALETVFEPFFRLESSRNRDTGGTGLGLSVARALAEAQDGALSLHNRYDHDQLIGLEARLTLPLLRQKPRRKVAGATL
jgi:signal transduction histidine kinase